MNFESFTVDAITRRRPLVPTADTTSSVHSSSTTTRSSQQKSHHGGGQSRIYSTNPKAAEVEAAATTTTTTVVLKRTLGVTDLIFYGVGCSVGAGIYSLIGIGAQLAGPSLALSFGACGLACCCTSLCYAEFAAAVPLAGSAYTFTYVTFGDLCGWLVGWNLTLGYAVSAAVVARSWAEYGVGFVQGIVGTSRSSHGDQSHNNNNTTMYEYYLTKYPLPLFSSLLGDDYTCCPLSMVIVGLCTIVLVTGVKESARFNTAMTILNLSVLGFVLVAGLGSGATSVDTLVPFFPHGIMGMARGAGLVFFSYLGFDMVACLSEEVAQPQRTLPIGIIGSLLVSMTIYVSVSLVVMSMAPANLLGADVPIVNALLAAACCSSEEMTHDTCTLSYQNCQPMWHPLLYHGSRMISLGAVFGLTTATFACLMGQPRIFYSMAQDGLLFEFYAWVHPHTGVPTVGTILTGLGTAVVACLVDLESLANAISLGTLQVFTFVCAGIILLRTRQPEETTNTTITAEDLSIVRMGEESPLLHSTGTTSAGTFTVSAANNNNNTDTLSTPLAMKAEPQAMEVARWLGIHEEPSLIIKESLRKSHPLTVANNGTKPVWLVVLFTVSSTMASYALANNDDWSKWFVGGCGLVMILSAIILFRLPQSPPPETFACPSVPLLPLLGILFNSYMMGSMPGSTWLVIGLWLLVGLLFYLLYGIHHSKLRVISREKQ